ncbi:MAG: hypothetical protein ACKVJH_08765 [Flavobacteriales bacterium]
MYIANTKLTEMKYLMTLMALVVAVTAGAQVTYPWNPDSNADEFIGFNDILDILAVYGAEFSPENLICNTDSSSVIVYTGEMRFAECVRSCYELSGNWEIPSRMELYRFDIAELQDGPTWINSIGLEHYMPFANTTYQYIIETGYGGAAALSYSQNTIEEHCYCYTEERPKLEYDYCFGSEPTNSVFLECVEDKLADGWYPLSGWINDFTTQGYGDWEGTFSNSLVYDARIAPVAKSHAAFWRWAE